VTPLNLFYAEPDPDRWLPFDRYPRRLVRRLVRGPGQPGGSTRVFLNLMAGLDRLRVPYRVNDFRGMRADRDELVCLIGKPHLLEAFEPRTPLLFGPAIYDHPIDDERLPSRHAVRQVLVPSAWVQRMFSEVWPGLVTIWPIGIDTKQWAPAPAAGKDVDVVLYDKLRRDRAEMERSLIAPILDELRRRRLSVIHLRYGSYVEEELHDLRRRARAMIYLSRHETQGIAVQQTMACDVPVLAWDPGGDWQSPEYLRRGVRFGPVTSVPYWDDRCGVKFGRPGDFAESFDAFWRGVEAGAFAPRQMILDTRLTREDSAQAYVDLARQMGGGG
jgi:glycosyltransferase involved in cell wall biosynthesis